MSTGISAADRARTIEAAVHPKATPRDIISPGHIPLRARGGGVLVRTGQTEGSVDLRSIAGLRTAGIICEIMKMTAPWHDAPISRRSPPSTA